MSSTSFNPAWVIQKKRDGKELSHEELREFINGITSGEVADYQATAFLMAVFFQGMTLGETVGLTDVMLKSGDRYDLSHIPGMKVDKHSTGGVGDKTSLIIAPLAAACGLKVPMMAGRGLGHTGGTLDKLEAIIGFDTQLTKEQYFKNIEELGCAIIGQTSRVAPADKKLYALRDVTATVECVPLIVGSILSKKISEGSEALVFDVKVGNGAFMKTKDKAKRLAKALIQVAKKMGVPARALLTDMNQPLGYAAGNAIEVKECISILRNEKSADKNSMDLKELTIQLTAHMLDLGGVVKSLAEGRKLARAKLADGSAWKVFERLVETQGGSLDLIRHPEKLAQSPQTIIFKAKKRGYIAKMQTEEIGKLLVEMGGGRKRITDSVDPGVGMIFHKKLGAKVQVGDSLVTVHAPEDFDFAVVESRLADAIEITGTRVAVPKLILEEF
jgi:pyrimidine-nucleoside phosphorylase